MVDLIKLNILNPPSSMKKHCTLKKTLMDPNLTFGLRHFAIWGGETIHHGKQSRSLNDFLKVFFARPGSNRSIKQEQEKFLRQSSWCLGFFYSKKNNK